MELLTKYHSKEWYSSKGYAKQNCKGRRQNDFMPMILSPRLKEGGEKCDCLFNRVSRKQYLITTSSSCLGKCIPAQRRKREGHQIQITSNQLPRQAWQITHCRKPSGVPRRRAQQGTTKQGCQSEPMKCRTPREICISNKQWIMFFISMSTLFINSNLTWSPVFYLATLLPTLKCT